LADLPVKRELPKQVEYLSCGAIAPGEFEPKPAEPIHEESFEGADLSDVLVQISVHRQRLGWTPVQVQEVLNHRFGKSSQALLTDSELVKWLIWLRGQVRSPS
jgi:hypothetical protein